MAHVRAFVGHSFTEEDEAVVGKFLKFFDQIERNNPDFSWTHAEPAEPKLLAEKVLSLIEDRTVFIGICTRKEHVVSPHVLKRAGWFAKFLKGPLEQYYWKTSDWIIQEIGLAKGRGLELILLVEEGLRQPGGLQGNIEYIAFARNSPEKAFGKILEMVTALLPKTMAPQSETSDIRSAPPAEASPEAEKPSDPVTTPDDTWTLRDYEFALFHCALIDDDVRAAELSDKFLASVLAKEEANKISWAAYRIYLAIAYGKDGSLKELEDLAKHYPNISGVRHRLALSYRHYQEHGKAAIEFEQASASATKVSSKVFFLGSAATEYAKANKKADVERCVDAARTLGPNAADGELAVLRALRSLDDEIVDKKLKICILERMVELDPSDSDVRFSLAHAHSNADQKELALFHYLKIPSAGRQAGTWNNLGVAYDGLAMPVKGVSAYRASESLGETLAMSNLAGKLIDAGFIPEALDICIKATKIKDYSRNVDHALARIKGIGEEEEKLEREIERKAQPTSDFLRRLGHGIAGVPVIGLTGDWIGPICNLNVTIQGTKFRAVGDYEIAQSGLIAAALLGGGYSSLPPDKYTIEYKGVIYGRAILCAVSRTKHGEKNLARSLLSDSISSQSVLMLVNDDGSEIYVMEQRKDAQPLIDVWMKNTQGTKIPGP